MANWRPVDVRLWDDRKFLACSQDARYLWLYFLTCPALPLPGVILGGDAAIAEQLSWPVERLRERLLELQRHGVKVVREGRIVWLRNALKYQPPMNPNMVKGWAKKWDDVPEGDLKVELWEALKIACKSWSVLFSKMFAKPYAEPLRDSSCDGSENRSGHEHQHEHQHEHETEKTAPPSAPRGDLQLGLEVTMQSSPPTPPRPRKEPTSDHQRAIAAFDTGYRERFPGKPTWESKQTGQIKRLISHHGADEVIRRIGILFGSPPTFLAASAPDVGTLVQHFDKLVAPAAPLQRAGSGTRSPALQRLHDEIAALEAAKEADDGRIAR